MYEKHIIKKLACSKRALSDPALATAKHSRGRGGGIRNLTAWISKKYRQTLIIVLKKHKYFPSCHFELGTRRMGDVFMMWLFARCHCQLGK